MKTPTKMKRRTQTKSLSDRTKTGRTPGVNKTQIMSSEIYF